MHHVTPAVQFKRAADIETKYRQYPFRGGEGVGATPIYKLYRYVQRNKVWFLWFSVHFASF